MKLELRLLGEFSVVIDGRALAPAAWEHKKAAELVKLLALAPGRTLVRDRVLDALWPHLDADAAAAALHKAASHARRATGESATIVLRGGEVALRPDATVSTDVDDFEAAAKKTIASGNAESCTRAAALYAGELLPHDRYAEWTESRRNTLKALHVDLLRKAGAWKDVVAEDPLDEDAHIALMRVYANAGRRAAALRQFRTLKTVLAEQLGVTPSPGAIALFDELSRGPAVHAPIFASSAMVGREVELARASAVLRKTAEGRGHTVFVRGEAGIGKTRFCEAVLTEAARGDVTTLRGAAPAGGAASYAPIVEAIDRLLGERADLSAALEPQDRDVLARLAAYGHDDKPITRQRILSAVGRLLKLASKERPVVLFVDDLHDADASTIDVVHYVGELARSQRIVMLAAMRPVDPTKAPAVERVRNALVAQRAATSIDLSPFTKADSAALAQHILRRPPDSSTIDAIHARAAGNPLFVELLATNAADSGSLAVPDELYAIVDGFVARLDAKVTQLLDRLAVLGDGFSAEELLAIACTSEDEAFALLDRALAARLVDESKGSYRFHHALVREAMLRRLPEHRRCEAHREAARALAAIGAPASRVAHQLLDAARPGEAVPWLVQAMRDARRVSAHGTALTFADLAIAHCDEGERADLLAERAELLRATGSLTAPAAYDAAIAASPPERHAALRVGKAYAFMGIGDVAGSMQALDGVEPPEDPVGRVRHQVIRGWLDWMRGDLDAAEKAAKTAKDLALADGIEGDLVEATLLGSMVAHSRGEWAANIAPDLLDVQRAASLASAVHDGHLCIAEFVLYGGRPYEEVVAFANEMRDVANKTGARRGFAFASCFLGEAELLRGDLDPADRHLAEAVDAARPIDACGTITLALQRRAQVALARGDRERARTLLEDALVWARTSPLSARHLLQRIYGTRIQAAADREAAIAVVDEAEIGVVGPEESCMFCSVTFTIPAAIACARVGQVERAHALVGMSTQLVDGLLKLDAWRAAIEEARGAIAMATSAEEARACFRRAAEIFARVGQKLDAARCEELAKSS